MPDTKELLDKIRKQTQSFNIPQESYSNLSEPISLLTPEQPKLKFEVLTPYKQDSVYKQLSSGERVAMFENYIPGTNNEERLAQAQGTGEKWVNGLNKFVGKTANAVVGGTVGTVNGVFEMIKQGSFDAVYDNDMSRWLDDLNTKLDYKLPNYYTQQEKDAGFVDSLTSANFLANDLLGGLSFTAGAIISEGIWAGLTGGTSLAASGTKWGTKFLGFTKTAKALNKFKEVVQTPLNSAFKAGKLVKDVANTSGRIGAGANALRFAITSTGYEASVEALHFKKEAEENFYEDFYKKNNRQPTQEEVEKARQDIEKASNGVFALNTAILIPSNIAMFGQNVLKGLPSPFKGITRQANKTFFGIGSETLEKGILKTIEPSKFQKITQKAYIYGKPAISEGLYEEGMQSTASKFMDKWLESQYNVDASNNTFSMVDAVSESLAETYGTKQGWKEIGIGMLIGSGASVFTGEGANQLKELQDKEQDFVDYTNTYQAMTLKQKGLMSNQIQTSIQRAETAREKNDKVEAHLASNEALIAQADYKYTVKEDLNKLTKEYQTALDNMTVEDFSEIGVEESQIEEYKQTVIDAHKSLITRYKNNRDYVELLFPADIKDIDTQSKSRALAFALTQGESSNFLMDDILQEMSSKIGQEKVDSIQAERLLSVAGSVVKNEVNATVKDLKILKNQYKELETKLRKEQAKPKKVSDVKSGGTQAQQNEYFNIAEQLLQVGEKVTQKQQELQDLTDRIKNEVIKRTDLEDVNISENLNLSTITTETLENLDDNLVKIDKLIQSYKETNPKVFKEIADLTNQYQKAKRNFFGYQDMAMKLSSGELDFKNASTWIGKKLKDRNMDEFTLDFFKSLDKYSENIQNDYVNSTQVEITEEPNPNKISLVKKDKSIKKEETEIEIIKSRINSALKERFYPISYIGDNYDELSTVKPSQKDVDRYNVLLNIKELTEEQQQEKENLKKKLADWRLVDSARLEDNKTIADLIEIVSQIETGIEEDTTLDNLDDNLELQQDFLPNSVYRPDILQNVAGGAVVQKRDFNGEPTLFFSHLKMSNIVQKLAPNVGSIEIRTVKEKKDKVFVLNKYKPLTQKSLLENQNVEGTQFKIGDTTFTIGAGATIAVSVEEYNKIKEELNLFFYNSNTASWSFQDVYEKLDNGVKQKKESEFKTNTISEDIYSVEKEDSLNLFLDFKTDWNLDLLNKSLIDLAEKDQITEETKNLIKSSLEITARSKNNNISTLKSTREGEITEDIPLEIRRRFAETFIESIEQNGTLTGYPNELDLGISVKVKDIFLGTPDLILDENDNPTEINFTEKATEQVIATGYVSQDTIKLSDTSLEDKITKQFITNIIKKNPSVKVPVIVFKKGVHYIAYPISLEKISAPKNIDSILNNNKLTEVEKVKNINKVLADLKIKPSDFNLTTLDSSKIESINRRLSEYQEKITAEDLADINYNKSNLIKDAKIKIDLENRKISSPKITVDFESVILPSGEEQQEEMINIRKNLTKEMQKIQREIESSSYLSDKNRFITAFDDTYIENIDSDIMNRKNVNFLKSLYFEQNENGTLINKPIQGDAVKLLTKDRINSIRKQLNRLMFLENQAKTSLDKNTLKKLKCNGN